MDEEGEITMKTKQESGALGNEAAEKNGKFAELPDAELKQVAGGMGHKSPDTDAVVGITPPEGTEFPGVPSLGPLPYEQYGPEWSHKPQEMNDPFEPANAGNYAVYIHGISVDDPENE